MVAFISLKADWLGILWFISSEYNLEKHISLAMDFMANIVLDHSSDLFSWRALSTTPRARSNKDFAFTKSAAKNWKFGSFYFLENASLFQIAGDIYNRNWKKIWYNNT